MLGGVAAAQEMGGPELTDPGAHQSDWGKLQELVPHRLEEALIGGRGVEARGSEVSVCRQVWKGDSTGGQKLRPRAPLLQPQTAQPPPDLGTKYL